MVWGPKQVLVATGIAISLFIFINGLYVAIVLVYDRGRVSDIGDTFTRAGAVARYADERLRAAADNQPLPRPPEILADIVSVKIGFATTLFYEVLLVAVVGGASRQSFRGLVQSFGLDRFRLRALWRPAVGVFAAYSLVAAYAIAVTAVGIDFLKPQSTLPGALTRDDTALAMGFVLAVIAAPISEEFFFRGLVFGGLLRWGFWPAAAVSAALFTLAHLDPGSIIPYFGVGIIMAYLYWARGSLWDSMLFHLLFNFTSFALLLAGS
jgi:membrane protease YdiL (CAAX protease family)